jgi:hypothetical protein
MRSQQWAVSRHLAGSAFVVVGELVLIADQGSRALNLGLVEEARLSVALARRLQLQHGPATPPHPVRPRR